MEESENGSIIISEVQSYLNARERFDSFFLEARNRMASERASQSTDDVDSTMERFPHSQAVEASLQSLGSPAMSARPASKEVVANLPTIVVTEETLMRLGVDTQCAVCSENLVINDKMLELPCKHLFHPLCLMPWLEKRNSCPVCRYELPTDNQEDESWKESEREAENARRDADEDTDEEPRKWVLEILLVVLWEGDVLFYLCCDVFGDAFWGS